MKKKEATKNEAKEPKKIIEVNGVRETPGTVIAEFSLAIPKAAAYMTEMAEKKDEIRPMMRYVGVNPSEGYIAASDTHRLMTLDVRPEGTWPGQAKDYPGYPFTALISSDCVRKCAGKTVNVVVETFERETTEDVYKGNVKTQETAFRPFRAVKVFDGEAAWFTEHKEGWHYPNCRRPVPRPENRVEVNIGMANVDALRKICSVHKDCLWFGMSFRKGKRYMGVEAYDSGLGHRMTYGLVLPEAASCTATVGLDPVYTASVLKGCDGRIGLCAHNMTGGPLYFYGSGGDLLMMPKQMGDGSTLAWRMGLKEDESASPGHYCTDGFKADFMGALQKLRECAMEYWDALVAFNTTEKGCNLNKGEWTVRQVRGGLKAKCGAHVLPADKRFGDPLDIRCGGVYIELWDWHIVFMVLEMMERISKDKTKFTVG